MSGQETSKQKSLIGGVSILAAAGLICKVVGVLYRIPLANTIGGEGLGLYSKVFQSYNLLLTISSAGIPVAISRLVAHYVTNDDEHTAGRVYKIALWALAVLGTIATFLLVAFSGSLASFAGAPENRVGYMAIAPSLLLVCLLSAYRGYLQGHRKMLPTAISQLIEQVGKLVIALPFAVIGMRRGGAAYGAAGMLLGTSVAEGAALVYMVIAKKRSSGEFAGGKLLSDAPDSRKIGWDLVRISVPITLGACIVPLAGWIDSFMVTALMEADGMEHAEALTRYGLYSSVVLSLINVPTAIAMAVSTNLVPDISSGMARHDMKYVAKESETGLKIASVIGLPCSLGMCILSRPILYLLFSGKYTPDQLDLAANILELSSLTICLFTMVQATSGILQGCGKQNLPLYTLAAGVACKIAMNYLLIGNPDINILGAPMASLVCYSVSMIPNLYFVRKYTGCKLNIKTLLLKPGCASLIMAGIVFALWTLLFGDTALQSTLKTLLGVILCLLAGVGSYALMILKTGIITSDELPAGIRRRLKKHV